jgi:D-alanyl-D-alanine carboxypeptidase
LARLTKKQAEKKARVLLSKRVERDKSVRNALLLVHSDKLEIHWKFANGINADQPFHVASIGKTVTSALIAKLYEKGQIDYEDPITRFLPSDLLEGLFVLNGIDYADRVLVRHLLNHTSGIADYISDKTDDKRTVIDVVIEDPSRFWTPLDTIQWAKNELKTHFPPGKGFHYSDTGYQLLGLAVEKITGMSFHTSLHKEIFDPLGMSHTYQLYYSEPAQPSSFPMANVYIGKQDVTNFKSISIDWAGGGLVSTSEDLLSFIQALKKNFLIKKETFDRMKDWARFSRGIDYGYGLMNFRFKDMFPLLSNKKNMWGNSGSLGSYMYYVPAYDTFLIGTFNQMEYEKKHVLFMLKVLKIISKL